MAAREVMILVEFNQLRSVADKSRYKCDFEGEETWSSVFNIS
jgi:hypothetical protein